ncbi:MAG TPA: nucleotide sugar dehydrogenase [Bryobacteraceae bacterium]|jgi:UDPglucose 6-dehydrogenase|nr:nucleotide sugar dehydrogenase [Bryobacteraceae bacterium]
MTICVFGLWHLGCVTAACVAEHFSTIGLDFDAATIEGLRAGQPPIGEPGLAELIQNGLSSGMLRFTSDAAEAISEAGIVWVTFDTPVDDDDRADVAYVKTRIESIFPHIRNGASVLISSQMPVGSTSGLATLYRERYPGRGVRFAYSPENLRLGKALDVFRQPERIVVGTEDPGDREGLRQLLEPFCRNLVWMSNESAEMTKHALNSFLANSIAFANEIGALCEETGADAKEVERGLKTDERIGPRAYLKAGAPYAGGTLARDVLFLIAKAGQSGTPVPLLESIRRSNDLHKDWSRRKLESVLGTLAGKTVGVLGLTYKPGTDTLRRSSAVELCHWLVERNVRVNAFDPAVQHLPEDLNMSVTLCHSAGEALKECDAAIIATEWPEFRELPAQDLINQMKTPVVLDANRFLEKTLGGSAAIVYIAVGMPKESS